MGVIVGVLLVLVIAVVGFFAFNSGLLSGGGSTKKVDVNISAPSLPSAPSVPAPSVPTPK